MICHMIYTRCVCLIADILVNISAAVPPLLWMVPMPHPAVHT